MDCQLPTILAFFSFYQAGDIFEGFSILAHRNFRVGPQIIVPGRIEGISEPGGN